MKMDQLPSISCVERYAIELESDPERALTDLQLLTLIDNCQGLTYDWRAKSYRLNRRLIGPVRHAGGFVRRLGNDRLEVEIHLLPPDQASAAHPPKVRSFIETSERKH